MRGPLLRAMLNEDKFNVSWLLSIMLTGVEAFRNFRLTFKIVHRH